MYRPVTIEEPQLISQAALAWNLDLQDWTGLGNRIYRLDTSEGKFVLKATFFPRKAEFSYIQRAQQHLWRQGFQQIAPPIPLEEGVFLFPWQDCSYFLSPFLQEKRPITGSAVMFPV